MLYLLHDAKDRPLDDMGPFSRGLDLDIKCQGCQRFKPSIYPNPIDWVVGRRPRWPFASSGGRLGIAIVDEAVRSQLQAMSDRVVSGSVSSVNKVVVRGFSTIYCDPACSVTIRGGPYAGKGSGTGVCATCKRAWSDWRRMAQPLFVDADDVDPQQAIHSDGDTAILVTPEVRARLLNTNTVTNILVEFIPIEIRKVARA